MKLLPLLFASLCAATAVSAQDIDFGGNSGEVGLNGICEDRRFEGEGMALNLSWADVGRDAQDCEVALSGGTISIWNLLEGVARTDCSAVEFGDNSSRYSDDGACDDPRFEGNGSAERPDEEHLGHDANDCQRLCGFDLIFLRDMAEIIVEPPEAFDTVYGNNSGNYARDNECDDRRFVGSSMATSLGWESIGRDAADCRAGVESGALTLWDQAAAAEQTVCEAIDFGNDNFDSANDGTCDDFRFEGLGEASHIFADATGGDATDCKRLCDMGMIFVRDVE